MAPDTSIAPARGSGRRSRRRGVPTPYDFRRPTKLSRQHARVLELTYETFCRQWATLLSSTLRTTVQVELDGVQQYALDEYLGGLPSPTIMAFFDPQPLPGQAVLHLDTAFLMSCVDRMLGGTGQGAQPRRTLTEVETVLAEQFIEKTLGELGLALRTIVDLKPKLHGIEQNPQLAQTGAGTDVIIVATFEVTVHGVVGSATLAMPLDPLSAALTAAELRVASPEELRQRRLMRGRLDDHLEDIPIEVAVRFDPARMLPEEILSLAPGDVVRLPHRADAPLDVVVNGARLASAVAGSRGPRLACLVVPTPEENR
ncbi:flagellar motor switch protein FliM [Kineococcus gynurae]|uniref:Flagellar motor switch protein FliM n=1 Tax=Kineococcus gynurae TaxID=452979 RepID=A0ABV5LR77_9ACTN